MMKHLFVALLVVFVSVQLNAQEVKKIKITELEKTIHESKTPLVINFWATWCMPCLEEIPYFQQVVKEHAKDSVQLILVSLDMADQYPAKLSSFVKKRKFAATIAWLDETDADYFCPKVDAKWSGSIPATLFINNKKSYRQFFEEQLSQEKFQQAISDML